jgi:hypothetical protein
MPVGWPICSNEFIVLSVTTVGAMHPARKTSINKTFGSGRIAQAETAFPIRAKQAVHVCAFSDNVAPACFVPTGVNIVLS